MTRLRRKYLKIVLKIGCDQFRYLLTLTEMHSLEERKWFLVTNLPSLPIFDCSNVPKC